MNPLVVIINNIDKLPAVADTTIVRKTAAKKRNKDIDVKWTTKNTIIWRKNLENKDEFTKWRYDSEWL